MKIPNTDIQVGDTLKSYAELCRRNGLTPKKGKQRIVQQEQLRQYYDWESVENSNRIRITGTYYDNPRFRKYIPGIHTTRGNKPMQELLHKYPWKPDQPITKTQMLINLCLIPTMEVQKKRREELKKLTVDEQKIVKKAWADYIGKMISLLSSAINQQGIKHEGQNEGLFFYEVIASNSGRMLSPDEEIAYKAIIKEALDQVNAKSILDIIWFQNEEKKRRYYRLIKEKTSEVLNISERLFEQYRLVMGSYTEDGIVTYNADEQYLMNSTDNSSDFFNCNKTLIREIREFVVSGFKEKKLKAIGGFGVAVDISANEAQIYIKEQQHILALIDK